MKKCFLGSEIESAAISGNGEIISAATRDENLYSLNEQGEVLWSKNMGVGINDLVLSSDGNVTAACDDSKIRTFDKDGILNWEQDVEGEVLSMDMCEKTKEIIGSTHNNHLVSLDKKGKVLWKEDLDRRAQKLALSKDGTGILLSTFDQSIISMERLEEDMEIFYEILCRGEKKCGTFVSAVYTARCPRCGSDKNVVRIIKETL